MEAQCSICGGSKTLFDHIHLFEAGGYVELTEVYLCLDCGGQFNGRVVVEPLDVFAAEQDAVFEQLYRAEVSEGYAAARTGLSRVEVRERMIVRYGENWR